MMDIYVIAFVIIPALIAMAAAAGVDDWYDKIHSRKRHPARHGISSRESVIETMEEE